MNFHTVQQSPIAQRRLKPLFPQLIKVFEAHDYEITSWCSKYFTFTADGLRIQALCGTTNKKTAPRSSLAGQHDVLLLVWPNKKTAWGLQWKYCLHKEVCPYLYLPDYKDKDIDTDYFPHRNINKQAGQQWLAEAERWLPDVDFELVA